jgi:hypothetical protein
MILKKKEEKITELNQVNFKGQSNVSLRDFKSLENELSLLKKELQVIKNQSEQERKQPVVLEVLVGKEEDPQLLETISEVLYFPSPNNDGSFNNSSSSKAYRDGASMYVIQKLSSSRGKFHLDERISSMNRALQLPDRNIIPVCDSINEYEPRFNRIKLLDDGIVELEGDKWIMKQKARIRYEN